VEQVYKQEAGYSSTATSLFLLDLGSPQVPRARVLSLPYPSLPYPIPARPGLAAGARAARAAAPGASSRARRCGLAALCACGAHALRVCCGARPGVHSPHAECVPSAASGPGVRGAPWGEGWGRVALKGAAGAQPCMRARSTARHAPPPTAPRARAGAAGRAARRGVVVRAAAAGRVARRAGRGGARAGVRRDVRARRGRPGRAARRRACARCAGPTRQQGRPGGGSSGVLAQACAAQAGLE